MFSTVETFVPKPRRPFVHPPVSNRANPPTAVDPPPKIAWDRASHPISPRISLSKRHTRSNQIDLGCPNPLFHGISTPLSPPVRFVVPPPTREFGGGWGRGSKYLSQGMVADGTRLRFGRPTVDHCNGSTNTRWNAHELVHPVQRLFEVRERRFEEGDPYLSLFSGERAQ